MKLALVAMVVFTKLQNLNGEILNYKRWGYLSQWGGQGAVREKYYSKFLTCGLAGLRRCQSGMQENNQVAGESGRR
jgi:hypothetical protein